MEDRQQPQATELEEAVLGALLLEQDSYFKVSDILASGCFYKQEYKYIFKAIKKLNNTGKDVDTLTVVEELRSNNQLKLVGGPGVIAGLTNRIASSAHLESHAMILREKWLKRQQISLGHRLIEMGYNNSKDPLESTDWAAEEVYKMATLTTLASEQTNEELAKEIMEDIYTAAKQQGLTGLKTGFREQDEVLGGYQAPNLVVWAARPGMGKTAKMLKEAYYMAVVLDIPVLIFSMEMSRKELLKRLAVIHADKSIGAWIYRQKGINNDYTRKFEQQLMELASKNIIIDDTPAITPEQMRNRAKKEIVKNGIKIIFADYLQLMTGKGDNPASSISYCSRKSKALAKELNVPVIMLAQVLRDVAKRGGEPQLSDLKGSGSIEEDADIVGFVHRPPYYDENAQDKKESIFIIAKHRNGALARIEARFLHARAEFVNPGEDVYKFDDDEKAEEDKDDSLPF